MIRALNLYCALCCSVQIAMAQTDWPAIPSEYSYFGAPTLDQTVYGNYAALQDKSNGTTFFNSPVEIHFRINNSAKMFLNNAGNFGIGTTTPGARLEVFSPGTGGSTLVYGGVLGSKNDGHEFNIVGGVPIDGGWPSQHGGHIRLGGSARGDINVNAIQFIQNGVERMHLHDGGNFGIGTNSPAAKTHINIASANTNYSGLTTGDISLAISNSSNTSNNLNVISFIDASSWGVAHIGVTVPSQSNHTGKLFFSTRASGAAPTQRMVIDENGKVGIGTGSPDQALTVNGTVHATRVKVEATVPAPDYVFEESYSLPTLDQVKSYIDDNKHLPEIPSAKEIDAKGIDVGEMNMLLLKKVEELTLYMIELKKENDRQQAEIDAIKKK